VISRQDCACRRFIYIATADIPLAVRAESDSIALPETTRRLQHYTFGILCQIGATEADGTETVGDVGFRCRGDDEREVVGVADADGIAEAMTNTVATVGLLQTNLYVIVTSCLQSR
jgi:hypothetical protein